MPNSQQPIRLLSPADEAHWLHAEVLISELKQWDVQQSASLGFTADEVIRAFYPDDLAEVRRNSVPPDGRFLLALQGQQAAGCAGFRRLDADACELSNVYVRPSHRGKSIGALLLQRLLSDARAAGYGTMRLETAKFMHTAHGLYRSLGFALREPYRKVPTRLAEATIWMECQLNAKVCARPPCA